MKYWIRRVVKPFVKDFNYRKICEIGASYGSATDMICGETGVSVEIIDPCLDADLSHKYKSEPRIKVYRGLSLDVLPRMTEKFDCFLIDGDHNWYTVYHELQTIQQRGLLADGGTIFFHDIGWPYGRRDMYYQPQSIPQTFLRPYARAGIVYGQSGLSSSEGANAEFCNAEQEGGPRNGVLTAIEDFMIEKHGGYVLFCFWDECGLGVLVKEKALRPRAVLKWRLISILYNSFGRPKAFLKHRFPSVHRLLRNTLRRRDAAQAALTK